MPPPAERPAGGTGLPSTRAVPEPNARYEPGVDLAGGRARPAPFSRPDPHRDRDGFRFPPRNPAEAARRAIGHVRPRRRPPGRPARHDHHRPGNRRSRRRQPDRGGVPSAFGFWRLGRSRPSSGAAEPAPLLSAASIAPGSRRLSFWPCDDDRGLLKGYWDDRNAADASAVGFRRAFGKFPSGAIGRVRTIPA